MKKNLGFKGLIINTIIIILRVGEVQNHLPFVFCVLLGYNTQAAYLDLPDTFGP